MWDTFFLQTMLLNMSFYRRWFKKENDTCTCVSFTNLKYEQSYNEMVMY